MLIIQIYFDKSSKAVPKDPICYSVLKREIKVRRGNSNFAGAGTRLRDKTMLSAFPENSQNRSKCITSDSVQ